MTNMPGEETPDRTAGLSGRVKPPHYFQIRGCQIMFTGGFNYYPFRGIIALLSYPEYMRPGKDDDPG
jgi:hypothetical protein